jgi:hypothetical protein
MFFGVTFSYVLLEAGQSLVRYSERARQSVEYEVKRAELAVEEQASLLERLHELGAIKGSQSAGATRSHNGL